MKIKLSLKEKVFFGIICNENRVYKHWYRQYLNTGIDLDETDAYMIDWLHKKLK